MKFDYYHDLPETIMVMGNYNADYGDSRESEHQLWEVMRTQDSLEEAERVATKFIFWDEIDILNNRFLNEMKEDRFKEYFVDKIMEKYDMVHVQSDEDYDVSTALFSLFERIDGNQNIDDENRRFYVQNFVDEFVEYAVEIKDDLEPFTGYFNYSASDIYFVGEEFYAYNVYQLDELYLTYINTITGKNLNEDYDKKLMESFDQIDLNDYEPPKLEQVKKSQRYKP